MKSFGLFIGGGVATAAFLLFACTTETGTPSNPQPDAGDAGDGQIPDASDGGSCKAGEVLQRLTAGCGNVPTECRSTIDDACTMQFCGCDGKTFSGRCGWTELPYASTGVCPADAEGGSDASDSGD